MERVQIAFFGRTNSGKSTLVNAICGQQVSLVSDVPGTTTDPVRKLVELPYGIGPAVLVDTAGYGDEGELGAQRERLTSQVIDGTDVAVLLRTGHPADDRWERLLRDAGVPVVFPGPDRESILKSIAEALPPREKRFLTGRLVQKGSRVLLVMPQDSEAPEGRIILPQVQVIRELLDRGCTAVCCTPESLYGSLKALGAAPDLVITDSQVFTEVDRAIPRETPLTSFSVLLAGAKGDVRVLVEGAAAIDRLKPGDRVLIAEACSHVPASEDIGRVKIPALLMKKMAGQAGGLKVDIAAGNDFPEDLRPYSLIIHCGACVATGTLVMSRIKKALRAGVPITNYGIALAKLKGIIDRISIP
ncbi:MAG: 50S ribosome-binding GTPase [Bacteroidales bacterium]|nr:50S ribosome-binding GTPase [Bacteroidales bacterium]